MEEAKMAGKIGWSKPNYMLMSVQRTFLISLLIASALVIVHYSPVPAQYFEDCDRDCNELDWPMICRVKLVVEVYKTLSKSCDACIGNHSCPPTCVFADGRERGILAANRRLPAPTLHVCQNDIIVVDVVHRASAHALTMHWRGQPQTETPFMDGVPMVTQCPQSAYTTFQYKFRASAAGTHMYHAHSWADAADGLAGALIVRQSKRVDPLKRLYDVDATDHTIFVAEWGASFGPLAGIMSKALNAESLLINGKGKTAVSPDAPLSIFTVRPGKRYRFRLIYGGGLKSCPVTVYVEEHALKVVAIDGHRIKPEFANSIEVGKGERVDFVLQTKQYGGVYKIKVEADRKCQKNLSGEADLVYTNDTGAVIFDNRKVMKVKTNSNRNFSTVTSGKCHSSNVLCLMEMHGSEKLSVDLSKSVDEIIYVPLNYSSKRTTMQKRFESWGSADGHRFTYPASPLLTQPGDIASHQLCPASAVEPGVECVHIKVVPLHSTVELVIFDQGNEENIFHLHGYSFYVVGVRQLEASLDKTEAIALNDDGSLFKKNLIDPVRKDTIVIPRFGAVALRFKADNPGYWIMRDEKSSHWTRGLDFVLKVGEESDFVKTPSDFPKCGSYVGPEYFLI